jgi:ABC-type Zn uptake system ZnuABC Zn-binding protein ZnuA
MRILVLNSMQSVTAADAAAGANYLDLANDNLEVLKEALK